MQLTAASFVEQWEAGPFQDDQGRPIAQSSPIVAELDHDGPSVVVGDRTGFLYALHLVDGTPVRGWPVYDGGASIDSTPSVAPLSGSSRDEVFVGEGNAQHPHLGGYEAFAPSGERLWDTQVREPVSDRRPVYGVEASLTVADLQGHPGVFAGSLGQEAYALDTGTGAVLTGWPFFSADSIFSTAAAADLYGTGQTELIVGGASTAGFANGQWYNNGGHLRIINPRGGQICRHDFDQQVDSSPAVGGFLPGGATGIAIGTGSYYTKASQSNEVDAFGTHCNLVWSTSLDGYTESSPAIADVTGAGQLDVVEGTDNGSTGAVYALDGTDGRALWDQVLDGRVIGGVVAADLASQGYDDLVVPTTHGAYVLDGRTGAVITVLGRQFGFQNSALVTEDPNGTVGITLAGYNGANEGVVLHFEVPGSNGTQAVGPGSWPMFHHDPELTGATSGLPAPGTVPPCQVPSAVNAGYALATSAGVVYGFGQPACARVAQPVSPVVGVAMAPDVGGYWVATRSGQVIASGSARFYGSMATAPPAPVTGIAATPDGHGYWLVDADGDVFGFGDAAFHGAMGDAQLNANIVGIASTPDGRGYWLAAADGGVFNFGDARFKGSAAAFRLNAGIAGIMADPATGGYWLVGSDGGVFNFNAPLLGSLANARLAAPVVGATPTADGGGYWLVSADGGVFAFGNAPYFGSATQELAQGTAVAGAASSSE